MTPRTIDPQYAVSEQIEASDVKTLAAMGFKTILCNRPDGEAAGQPPFASVALAARELGLVAEYLPIAPQGAGPADHQAFVGLIDRLPKPVLAYCRSGNRSATLWQGLQAHRAGAGG